MNKSPKMNVGIIGFGEVGQIFAKGLIECGHCVYVYDILLQEAQNPLTDKILTLGAEPVDQIQSLGKTCSLIISVVSSSASESVSRNISETLVEGTMFLDLTTSTPQRKNTNEKFITSVGGTYIDGAIMGTVATDQFDVPLLIAGEKSKETSEFLNSLGFHSQEISLPNGGAASIKLIRSVFMKGLEALIIETMVAAKKFNVADEVMESVSKTINNNDFTELSNALITTHVIHRNRRYKEVLDSSNLIQEADVASHVLRGVISFFSSSVATELSQEVLNSKDVSIILEQYIQASTIKNYS